MNASFPSSCSALNVVHITVYHVLNASTGEQIFEDEEESIAKSRALEFVAALMDEPHNNGPVTIWRTGDIRKPNALASGGSGESADATNQRKPSAAAACSTPSGGLPPTT